MYGTTTPDGDQNPVQASRFFQTEHFEVSVYLRTICERQGWGTRV